MLYSLFVGKQIIGYSPDLDSLGIQGRFDLIIGKVGIKADKKMKPCIIFDDFTFPRFFDKFYNLLPLLAVVKSHAVYMLFKISFGNEPGKGVLFKIRDGT